MRVRWVPARVVNGVPYDTPILGYRVNTANTLRLWRAEAPESFDFSVFNRGDYWGAVNQKVTSENITKVLYPNDEQVKGKELRLEQQYFFVACSLQDMLRIIRVQKIPPERFHEKFAMQLNDTHPSIAVAELMRLLVDELALDWDAAWEHHARAPSPTPITRCCPRRSSAGRWTCSAGCCRGTWRSSTRSTRASSTRCASPSSATTQRLARMSLIDESGERYVRMAHLATRRQSRGQRRRRSCTPSCSRATCCAISTSCGRRSSATRPTA